jgi:hypothetical protein
VALAPAASAPAMQASSASPEHVADALKALDAGHAALARKDFNAAIADRSEPAAARGHAREALAALKAGKGGSAKGHAENGAAVEHFTYALRALQAGSPTTASGHLTEATGLPSYKHFARAALAAIHAHRNAQAIADSRDGLNAAVRAP